MSRFRRSAHRLAAALFCAWLPMAAAATVHAAPTDSTPPWGPPAPNWWAAMAASAQHPDWFPSGMNDWSCKPSTAHPKPVVLVHGFIDNAYAAWSVYSPTLAAEGYCVYGLNYGGADNSPYQGAANMRASAAQLADFVDTVRTRTGAAKVDMVALSEGRLLGPYYINKLGGHKAVDRMIGIEPASNGIAAYGLMPAIAQSPFLTFWLGVYNQAGVDFTANSRFVNELRQPNGPTHPDVHYTTIASTTDGALTLPEMQWPAAPNVTNVVIQDSCPDDHVDHVGTVYDDITLRLVRNALDPATAQAPRCHPVGPTSSYAPGN
ncbi:alpha/beta fold hydrolase [Gordonia sp. CPCC 205515]|uniref:esterase/lipase family protein n=1 Tax=Gordonia sp. CPCC 205515 TaxID=3140791 RepID=UPI003AF3E2FE